jgi:hypothetical protein
MWIDLLAASHCGFGRAGRRAAKAEPFYDMRAAQKKRFTEIVGAYRLKPLAERERIRGAGTA